MASGGDEPVLPLEIIINILKKLPVKSIIRFRCVCKDWKNLFKTAYFIAEQLRHSQHKNPFLLLCERNREGWHSSLRLLNYEMETVEVLRTPSIINSFRGGWRIIGSCNGLLCVESIRGRLSICLWNPLIREVREIPQTTNDYSGFCRFGFGFSSIVNDYKIVKFYNQELRKKRERYKNFHVAKQGYNGVEVYSLSTDSWKELEFRALQNINVQSATASADGTMVWLGQEGPSLVLVSFDLVREVFAITPITSVGRNFSATLGLYQEKFAMCWRQYASSSWDIWVIEAAGESGKSFSCTEKCSVDTFSSSSDPVCIWRNGIVFRDIRSEAGVEGNRKHFLSLINFTTKELNEFQSSAHGYDAGVNYESSLVSVWNT